MKRKIPVLLNISREKITRLLKNIPGKKDLIIDPNIIKPLENIIGVGALRSLDVEKIYKFHDSNIQSTTDIRVFLIYTDLTLVKLICDHINSELSKNETMTVKFYLILVPRVLFSVSQLLEEEGVYEYIKVSSLQWELIPLSNFTVSSLELKHFFNYLFVNGDQSFLPIAARSIWSTFLIWGNPCTRICLGNHSQNVSDMVDIYFKEIGKPENTNSEIDCFIIMDRDIDYVSTLLTPATYTSLLDEVFGIHSGFIELNDGLRITLNDQEIYLQIKNRHFSHVISFLKDKAKTIQDQYEKSRKMKVQEIKEYIKKDLVNVLEQKKSLSHHISACETIIKKLGSHFENFIAIEENMLQNQSKYETLTFIEDYLALKCVNKYSVLRLICLLSVTQNGLTAEDMKRLKSQFVNAYGYKYIPLFHNLEKLGLFLEQSSSNITDKITQIVPLSSSRKKNSVHQMIQKLKLIPNLKENSDSKTQTPSDMSYVFNGSYIPAICQLVHMLNSGKILKNDVPKYFTNCKIESKNNNSNFHTFYVYFVGGVTYAEVAAFQFLEKLTGCQIMIGATNIINSKILCKSCK